jgi:uncharacterized membrane protein YqaE (UPF0057 family)
MKIQYADVVLIIVAIIVAPVGLVRAVGILAIKLAAALTAIVGGLMDGII